MTCRRCQYAYPRDTESCPSCGLKNPGTPAVRRLRVAAVLLGIVALAFLCYLWSKYDQFSGAGSKPLIPGNPTSPSDSGGASDARFK